MHKNIEWYACVQDADGDWFTLQARGGRVRLNCEDYSCLHLNDEVIKLLVQAYEEIRDA